MSGRIWARVGEIITTALQDESFEVDARRCRERTMLLLDYYKKQDFPSLRRLVVLKVTGSCFGGVETICVCVCGGGSGLGQRGCTPKKKICSMKFWSWRRRRVCLPVVIAPIIR